MIRNYIQLEIATNIKSVETRAMHSAELVFVHRPGSGFNGVLLKNRLSNNYPECNLRDVYKVIKNYPRKLKKRLRNQVKAQIKTYIKNYQS